MRCIWLMLALVVGTQAETSDLQKRLEKMAKRHHGKIAFVAKDLKTGARVDLGGEELVPTASTIKLLAFVEAFHAINDGTRHLDDPIVLRREDQVKGSGVFQFFRTPHTLTFEDAIAMMMIQSDNTGTNLVIDHLGRDRINARGEALGLKNTYLYKKVYRKAEGPMPPDQKKFGLGKTTAADMAKLMESIVTCELNDAGLCAQMIKMMKNQSYRNMIPHYIEPELDATEGDSKVADKIGQIDESRSDVAVVFSDRGPIVIAAYSYENEDTRWTAENEGEQTIARMAKAVFDAWGKPAKGARVK